MAESKSEDEADNAAHDTATAHWNAWAEALLAERKAMEADGCWASLATDWKSRATADFKFCLFLNKGTLGEEKEADAKAATEKRAAEAKDTVKSIDVDWGATRWKGFIFPGDAWFDSATASAIQKLISGVLIFLFGLALRNMLKVK